MTYVDGFVLAVPADKLADYEALARKAGEVWMEYGALSYVECVADDVPYGKLTSFPRAVMATDGETTVFAWITYKSREDRDSINARVMADPRMKPEACEMLFDTRRMIVGGYRAIVEM